MRAKTKKIIALDTLITNQTYLLDMLLQDKIDYLATLAIPNVKHPVLHVNCRHAWVRRVAKLIKNKQIKPTSKNLVVLAHNWETLLFYYYSTQN